MILFSWRNFIKQLSRSPQGFIKPSTICNRGSISSKDKSTLLILWIRNCRKAEIANLVRPEPQANQDPLDTDPCRLDDKLWLGPALDWLPERWPSAFAGFNNAANGPEEELEDGEEQWLEAASQKHKIYIGGKGEEQGGMYYHQQGRKYYVLYHKN